MGLLNSIWFFMLILDFGNALSRTQQVLNTLMPGTPLFDIFLGVNSLTLGGLQIVTSINLSNFLRYIKIIKIKSIKLHRFYDFL